MVRELFLLLWAEDGKFLTGLEGANARGVVRGLEVRENSFGGKVVMVTKLGQEKPLPEFPAQAV